MKRTQKSIINVIASVGTNAIILITAFIVQKALVSTMGGDYNGINGLFSSIISMMSLADLGIGTAIIYHMYQPVAERGYGEDQYTAAFLQEMLHSDLRRSASDRRCSRTVPADAGRGCGDPGQHLSDLCPVPGGLPVLLFSGI